MRRISKTAKLKLLRTMVRIRRFEEKIVSVYGVQDMKTPVHLSIGQEAVAAGVCVNLEPEDYVFSTHRNHGHLLAKGAAMAPLVAELYGRASGCSKGKGGSMHMLDTAVCCMGTSAIVGGVIPLAAGAALASLMRRENRISVSFFGDGASEEGLFHEALNFAALKKLPVIFVCENNGYATNSPLRARQPQPDIAAHAPGYGLAGVPIDGNDVLAVCAAAASAIAGARAGMGPTLLECKTYRWKGHVGPDCDYLKGCRPREELDAWIKRCPVESFKRFLLHGGIIAAPAIDVMIREIDAEISEAWAEGLTGKMPVPGDLYKDVY